MSSSLPEDEFPNQLSSVDDHHFAQELRQRSNLWHSNYHEASIYIEEGLNNDKFENHPRKRASLAAKHENSVGHHQDTTTAAAAAEANQTTPLVSCVQQKPFNKSGGVEKNGYLLGGQYTTIETYILVHNRYFYQLDLAASIVLLLLALVEPPAVEGYELNPTLHAAIEMFGLGIIAIELLLKFRWMGPKRFFHHGRTVIKLIVLLTMNVEAIVIFLRHSIHARYSRALRPIFLIDNHYCHGMRRAIRQIFQSLPPILDMFTLALFFMFVFSIFGFYLFAETNTYFSDMPATVGNLLILATTASLPDVMMPSYAVTRWSTIFFVLFIVIHLFLLTNLTMAAVYESFTRKEKEKFHKLLLHRRKACQKAFKLLVSRRQPTRIQYRQFMGLMRYLNRKCSMFDTYLIFKALDTDKNGSISLEEFYQIYDFINLEWKMIYPETRWYDDISSIPSSLKYLLRAIKRIVSHRYFEWTVDILIVAAAFLQFVEANAFEFATFNSTVAANSTETEATTIQESSQDVRPDSISTFIFICLFGIEALLRCLALGFFEYIQDGWNKFDLAVWAVSLSGLITGYFGNTPFGWVIVLRILRVMRLFELKRRYKDIWQTLTYILLKRFVSMTCVVMILYYFFAIIGMELLGDYDLRNCCKNTSLESQFKYDNSPDGAKYYLNDFGDIVASYLTLFSMSSNTYWLATMNAYAIVSETDWVRLFFGVYYLCSIIVMNIVIAFILESFLFRIHYRSKMGNNCDDTNLFTVTVTLSSSEVEFLRKNLNSYTRDKNFEKLIKFMAREQLDKDYTIMQSDDKILILEKKSKEQAELEATATPPQLINLDSNYTITSDPNDNTTASRSSLATSKKGSKRQISKASRVNSSSGHNNNRYYFIYQAEQIRNKFSFTMKMYADEVESWLAEAERDDQDEMSAMISANQIRAEHVAIARLVRRSVASAAGETQHLLQGLRGRSYSSSGGIIPEHQIRK